MRIWRTWYGKDEQGYLYEVETYKAQTLVLRRFRSPVGGGTDTLTVIRDLLGAWDDGSN
jgi:hypothetical protein